MDFHQIFNRCSLIIKWYQNINNEVVYYLQSTSPHKNLEIQYNTTTNKFKMALISGVFMPHNNYTIKKNEWNENNNKKNKK